MYIKKYLHKRIAISLFTITLLLITIISTSYGIFMDNKIDNLMQVLTVGDLLISYEGGSAINLGGITPETDLEAYNNPNNMYTFTIENTGVLPYKYKIYLENNPNFIDKNLLNHNYIKFDLNNNGKEILGGKEDGILLEGVLNPGEIKSYNLRIWVSIESLPNSAIGSEVHLNIMVNGKVGTCDNCLNTMILALEGGASEIESKEIPAFSNISPGEIKYKELTNESSTVLSSTIKYIGTGYIFDSYNGVYDLVEPTLTFSYSSSHIGKYTCNNTSSDNCSVMYKIKEVTGTTVTNSTEYTVEAITPFTDLGGIYAAEDEYGMSYYYRGDRDYLKNNLIFGEYQWKIIRINGDGSIRMIYNGECPNNSCTINTTGVSTQIGESVWSSSHTDNKYVGYMYGGANGASSTSRAGAVINQTNANAKSYLDDWYQNNISGKAMESKIVDKIFCNDRMLQSEVGGLATGAGYGTATTNYAAYYRLRTMKNPSLKCGLKNDRFTTKDSLLGNAALTYPVGLITADELALAGFTFESDIGPNNNYLYTNQYYWSMTPSHHNGAAFVWFIYNEANFFNNYTVHGPTGIRPVINLSAETRVKKGDGSASNPFVVS